MSSHRQHRRNNHEHGAGPPHGRDQRWVGVAASGVGDVPPPAAEHAGHGRDELVPVVRTDVLGVPGDPVGRRHGRDRRRVQPVHRAHRSGVRHLRRPAPQEGGDGALDRGVDRLLRRRHGRVRRRRPDLAAVAAGTVVLGAGGLDVDRLGRRPDARHRAVDVRHAARSRRPPRSGQRHGRHGDRGVVRHHLGVQRAGHRPAGDGLGALRRAGTHHRCADPPGRDHHRRAGARSHADRRQPRSTCAARSTPSAPCLDWRC